MDKSFREVARSAMRASGALTHQQTVTRMYRRALRAAMDWGVTRENFYALATEIRDEFHAAKALPVDSP
jgi:hypothetical protein